MTSNLTRLAKELFPLLVPMFEGAGIGDSSSGGSGSTLQQHDLSGPFHSGTLANAQAPQFLLVNGSRPLTGNLGVVSGVTVDGVDISAFKDSYDAHLLGDSHGVYAHAEGFGTRPAYAANRLYKDVVTGAGSGITGGGTLTSSLSLVLDWASATPAQVGLTGSVGVGTKVARHDHTHAIDQSIAPTWTDLHIFNGGARIGAAVSLQFGTDTAMARGGADLIVTSDAFRALRLGANVDPSYPLDVKAQASDTYIARLTDNTGQDQARLLLGGNLWLNSGTVESNVARTVPAWVGSTFTIKAKDARNQGGEDSHAYLRILDGSNARLVDYTDRYQLVLWGEALGDNSNLIANAVISAGKNVGGSYYSPGIGFGTRYAGGRFGGLTNEQVYVETEIAYHEENPGNDPIAAYNSTYAQGGRAGLHPYFGRLFLEAAWGANSQLISTNSFQIRTLNDAAIPLILKARATQSGNLFQLRNSADGVQGFVNASYNWGLGIASGTDPDVRLRVRHGTEPLRLEWSATKYSSFLVDSDGALDIEAMGNVTLSPAGDVVIDPTGNDGYPAQSYRVTWGTPFKKWLSMAAAELIIDTLVAQDVLSTVGGAVDVIPTTVLTRDINSTDTTIYVKHNQQRPGDIPKLEARQRVEFMEVVSGPTEITPNVEYSYVVNRSIDPTGANAWLAGDGVQNTGITGSGWMSLYARQGAGVLSPDYLINRTSGGTNSANLRDESEFTLFGDTAVNGQVVIGCASPWENLYFWIRTAASGTGTVAWEYWNGSAWTAFLPTVGGAATLTSGTGLYKVEWLASALTGWASLTIDGMAGYWIRARLTSVSSFTRPAQGTRRVFSRRHTFGPTAVALQRNSSTYYDWGERAAWGNLNGWYGYGTDTFGFAAGKYQNGYITVDESNGLRLYAANTLMGHWKVNGDLIVGPESGNHLKASIKAGTPYLEMIDGAGNVYTELTTGQLRLGVTTGNYTVFTGSAIDFRNSSGTSLANLSGSTWRLGLAANRHIDLTSSEIAIKENTTSYFRATSSNVYVGDEANEHVEITTSGVRAKDGATIYAKFAATTEIGATSAPYLQLTSSAVDFRDSGVSHAYFSPTVFRVGQQGSGFAWIEVTSSYLKFRSQSGVTTYEPLKFQADGTGFLERGLELGSTGYIKSGRDYASGSGFWVGLDSGSHKLVVGNSSGAQLQWSGSALTLRSGNSTARTEFTSNGLRGYNSGGTVQVEVSNSDGKLRAAAGAVILDEDGIVVDTDVSNGVWFRIMKSADELFTVESFENTIGSAEVRTTLYSKRTSVGSYLQLQVDHDGSTVHQLKLDGTNEVLTSTVKGNFSTAGIRTKQVTSVPTGGDDGDIQIYHSGATYRIYVKLNGTWRYAALT